MLIFWSVILLLQLPALLTRPQVGTIVNAIFFLIAFGIPIIASLLIRPAAGDMPPLELRLHPIGTVLCLAPDMASSRARFSRIFFKWAPVVYLALIPVAFVLGETGPALLMLAILISVWTAIWLIGRRNRMRTAKDPATARLLDGAIFGEVKPSINPWSRIEKIEISKVREGCYRFQLIRSNSWYAGHAADLEVDCSREVRDEVEKRMALWRNAAIATAGNGETPVMHSN